MTLREISALATVLLIVIGAGHYIYLALTTDRVKPVLASWIVITATMILSFSTYWTTPGHSLVSNASNAIGIFSTIATLTTAIYIARRDRQKVTFSPFQVLCLLSAFGIMSLWITMVWGFKKSGAIPNFMIQVLMVIGHLMTVQRIWCARKNTEDLVLWWCVVLASATGIYTASVSSDPIAMWYAIRATFTSALIVGCIYFIRLMREWSIH